MQDSSGQSISDGSIWNTSIGNNTREGLQYLKLNDGSYVTAWQETQDGQSVIGIGYQRFDSEGNALASELIRHEVPRPMKHNSSNISLEAGQGSNDFTVSLNSTGETFNVSSIGEKVNYIKQNQEVISDFAGSKVGDVPDSPVIPINEKIVRGNVTQSLHSFKYEPTGTVSNENGDGSVPIKMQEAIGLKIFSMKESI